MSDTVISIENVSKAYRLGQIGGGTLKEDFARWWAKLRRKPDPFLKIGEEHHARKMGEQFWALDGVSFQVKQGEVLGIIGRNGAGKSTLLKILSQVTTPTSGNIKIKGRIASLLEVGTGFHPELTGRENIFLNGAILGMTKAEIRKKFDEIVAFSEIEEFIDTPVKRYSSGMYVRLAFAVAAHLEPEILICDEVLAVGDAEFQKKCLGKMKDVSRSGRTVLFVSHNMAAVKNLCEKGVLLENGKVRKADFIEEVLRDYLTENTISTGLWQRQSPIGSADGIFFEKATIINSDGHVTGLVGCTDDFSLNLNLRAARSFDNAQVSVRVSNHEGVVVFTTCNTDIARRFIEIPAGRHLFHVRFPGNFLSPGRYSFDIVIHTPRIKVYDRVAKDLILNVEETGSIETFCRDTRIGVINKVFPWEHVTDSNQVASGRVS
jgi:lipopolysaccharide transport system ATP-binding protein